MSRRESKFQRTIRLWFFDQSVVAFFYKYPPDNLHPPFSIPQTTSQSLLPFSCTTSSESPNIPKKISMAKIGLLDLEKHFAFYGAYHRNSINILIHTLFVWPILFTALILLYFTPPFFECPFKCRLGLLPNLGLLLTVIYALFYICLDKKAGSLAAFLCVVCWVSASLLAKRLGFSLAWKVVLASQLFCWTGQFLGHGVFEKRAPALLDNLAQAFIMAPFFVLLEALQFAFGYEPYEGFHAKVKSKVEAEVKSWQEKREKKSS